MPNGIISFVHQDIADGNPSTTEIAALEEQYYLDVSKGKYVIPYGLTKEAYRNCLENLYLYGTIEGTSKLSNSKVEHVLKNHTAGRMQNTVDVMMEKGLVENAEKLVNSKGFFNTSWTEQQVIDATSQAYNQALINGVPNTGSFDFTTSVFGENVT